MKDLASLVQETFQVRDGRPDLFTSDHPRRCKYCSGTISWEMPFRPGGISSGTNLMLCGTPLVVSHDSIGRCDECHSGVMKCDNEWVWHPSRIATGEVTKEQAYNEARESLRRLQEDPEGEAERVIQGIINKNRIDAKTQKMARLRDTYPDELTGAHPVKCKYCSGEIYWTMPARNGTPVVVSGTAFIISNKSHGRCYDCKAGVEKCNDEWVWVTHQGESTKEQIESELDYALIRWMAANPENEYDRIIQYIIDEHRDD